jgi:N-acylneuraminate cytidylyltransferase
MVVLDEQDYVHLVIPPSQKLHARQDAPPIYDLVTVAYAARPDHVLNKEYIFDGKVRAVVVPRERAVDIDSEVDCEFAEFMLGRRSTGTT